MERGIIVEIIGVGVEYLDDFSLSLHVESILLQELFLTNDDSRFISKIHMDELSAKSIWSCMSKVTLNLLLNYQHLDLKL
jgi:hypothetical protein